MRILFIVPYVPNLIRTRSYNLIRGLVKRGHSVTLLTLWSDEREYKDLAELETICDQVYAVHLSKLRSLWNCVVALPTRTPLQAVYCWQPELANYLEQLSHRHQGASFDVIHVEHLRGANYGLEIKKYFPDTPIIWDSVDCISYLFAQATARSRSLLRKSIMRLELGRTRAYEGWLSNQFNHVLISSPIDKELLLELRQAGTSQVPVSVLPNGVDWEYFTGGPKHPREPAMLVFSGKMSYHANISMALYLVEEIMPLVWGKRADIQLYIVGKDPPANIRQLSDHPQITVTGSVEDIRPYLNRATAALVPLLYGAGSQFKVLEAMACGTPVVATPGAVSALEVVPGTHVLIAQSPENFASTIIELIEKPSLQRQIGEKGQAYVEEHHSWSAIAETLEGIYSFAISKKI